MSAIPKQHDWAGNLRPYLLAWGLPSLLVIGGAFVAPFPRTLVWAGALAWMGSACLINARRCGRTHCRFTGPFYLALIVPVCLHGLSLVSLGPYAWWVLGALILLGSKVISFAADTTWGKYATRPSRR